MIEIHAGSVMIGMVLGIVTVLFIEMTTSAGGHGDDDQP